MAEWKNFSQVVEGSLKNLVWIIQDVEQTLIDKLSSSLHISAILARIIINRGIVDVDKAWQFINPTLKELMPNPFLLRDMDKAAARIANAIQKHEKITVFGDYDVDGATSTALMRRFFRDIGVPVEVYIPSRMHEGYGPTIDSFAKIRESGSTLIITVDCGVVSFDALEYAKQHNIDVVVLDHHLSIDNLPPAVAIVNPNRLDETFAFKSLAAVSIAFLAITAVRSELRDRHFFVDKLQEIDLIQYLDLVALGTVCDVMLLQDVNRAFVKIGLQLIANRNNVGLTTLAKVSKIEGPLQSYHLGFVLGPRINAGGRVGEGILGSDLLYTEDPHLALELSERLDALNNERKTLEALILEEALNSIQQNNIDANNVIMVHGQGWHQGVLGILASRIKERFNKPAMVVSIEDGIGKGSARSIPGIDLGSMLADAKAAGVITQGGGHAMAGGFVLDSHMLPTFYDFILQRTQNAGQFLDKVRNIQVDAILDIEAINKSLLNDINQAAPFGHGNQIPKFVLTNVQIVTVRPVGRLHLMMIVKSPYVEKGKTVKCILFRAVGTELGDALFAAKGKKINLLGTLQENLYNQEQADFIIEDASFI